jgi:hypothetical protein
MLLRTTPRAWVVTLGIALVVSSAMAACGSSKGTTSTHGTGASFGSGGSGASAAGGAATSTGSGLGASFAGSGGASTQGLAIEPSGLQTITVTAGQTQPTLSFKATNNGQPTNVGWTVDRGNAATIGNAMASSSATFAPTGTAGGLVNVIATQNSKSVHAQVFIKLVFAPQNGANASNPAEAAQVAGTPGQLTQGGGIGGVGGEGLGGPATNFPTTTMPASAMGLTMLYPYDKTVWPRGMLAPLLQWAWTPADADAIQIALTTTSGSFSWSGTFGRPAVLGMGGGAPSTFTRHPIPQDVWAMATNTAGGVTPGNQPDQLVLSLTVAKGGVAYGPLTETWNVAPANLAGTVYYNSYGTSLVKNSSDNDANGNQYGAAVLGITGGATAPVVVSGPPSGLSGAGCRVCHVVAGNGNLLIAQHGDQYAETSWVDLKNGNNETPLTGDNGTFGWAGLNSDGSLALTNTAQLAAGEPPASQLYTFPPSGAPTPLAAVGIPSDFQAGAPAFSADDKHVAFELLGGTLGSYTGTYSGASQLVALDFDKGTMTFSNPRLLATMPGGGSQGGGGLNAGLPSFFPTNDAVAFHDQIGNPSGSHRYNTWHGATAQVWWSDLATGTATIMSTLNGLNGTTSYLPTNAQHPDDTTLNFEPTMNPVVSGGYAWVIFTSRRMYGSLAAGDPTLSDPRGYDYTQYANVTTKKLWVAAVDIGSMKNGMFVQGVTPGTDPSHPAFYLPGQELVAGNARGFWVLDPCKADGASCMTGDQCCGGFCEPNGDGGGLVCGPPSSGCAGLQDKCTTAANCCDTNAVCINGFCAQSGPQ